MSSGTVRPRPLSKKVVVGHASVQNNFGLEEKAFAPSDVPAKAKDARKAVRQLKRSQVLGSQRKSWNVSTEVAEPLCRRSGRQLSAYDQPQFAYNYRSEVLPEAPALEHDGVVFARTRSVLGSTKRVEEMPVHPSLSGKAPWNPSTAVMDAKEKLMKQEELTTTCKRVTSAKAKELKSYRDPVALEREHMRALRRARAQGPAADAAASAPPEMSVKPVTVSYTSTVSRRFKKYHHTGVFEKSKFSKSKAWSCCMSEDPDGRGCIVTTVNPDAYNFVSIN